MKIRYRGVHMFEINDYIIYGSDSVCKVIANDIDNINTKFKDKKYYKLQPLFENKSTIYTPVDNNSVAMRKIISKEEAASIISNISNLDKYSYDDKVREETYKKIMHNHDCRELISMLKTVYYIKKQRLSENKNVIAVDKRNTKIIEEWLGEEFSVAMGITREEAKEIIDREIIQSYNNESKLKKVF